MKTTSSGLAAHLKQKNQTLAWLWKVTRQDGRVYGFTTHDQDIVLAGVTYSASSGMTGSAAQSKAGGAVDNMELAGMLGGSAVTDVDILAGLWDGAAVEVSFCNWADLSQGASVIQTGTVGNLSWEGISLKVESRSTSQALQQTVGRTMRRQCDANLGDARCGVDLAAHTVTGTVTGTPSAQVFAATTLPPGLTVTLTGSVTATIGSAGTTDRRQIFVPSLAPDRLGGLLTWTSGANNGASSNVDSTDPGAIALATSMSHDIAIGDAYTITDAYTGGGLLTWTAGANLGLTQEVKTGVGGTITLVLPMTYAVAIGDAYSVTAGCDKNRSTCQGIFNNATRFRGFPDIPGIDAIMTYPNAS